MEHKCAHGGSNAGVGVPHHFVWCLWWECCSVWSPLMGWCEWAVSSWASCKWERSAKDKYKILAQWTKMYHLVSDQGCHSQRKGQLTHENFLEQVMSQFWLTKLHGKLTIDTGSGRDSRNCPGHVPHCVRLSVQEWKWRKSYHRSQTRTWGACQLVFDWGAWHSHQGFVVVTEMARYYLWPHSCFILCGCSERPGLKTGTVVPVSFEAIGFFHCLVQSGQLGTITSFGLGLLAKLWPWQH